ncbi:MAG: CGNR zinc finger domain-containing protein [Solirubrobacteraceae bacterium]
MTDTHSPHAPHSLDLVIDFVNTLDIDENTDVLSSTDGLSAWLVQAHLLAPAAAPPSDAEHRQALQLREALRALMLANNGATPDQEADRELELAARRGELGVHFAADGSVSLAPSADGFAGALARLLIPLAEALGDGSWQRVKACRADDCQWAFYDRSRNRSGVWCEMAVCGNRKKVRAYRDRGTRARG